MSCMHDFARDYRFAEDARNDEVLPPELRATFEGYVRANGKTGTRNYIGILTSVNCSASVAKFIAEAVNRSGMLDDYPEIDGVVAVRARHRLRHGGLRRGLRRAAADAVGLRHASQSRRRADGRPRLRGVPDRPHEGGIRSGRGRSLPDHDDPGDRRHAQDRSRRASSASRRCCRSRRAPSARRGRRPKSCWRCNAAARTAIPASPPIRRSAPRSTCWSSTAAPAVLAETPEIYGAEHLLTRRAVNRDGRREAGRAHPLVGGLHRAQSRRDEQQPVARQQGRRAHHHPGEIARRRRQGRHHDAARRLRIRRAGQGEGLRLHGYARLRPGRRDRPGRRRLQRHVLHHRPRLGLRLQADALDQARHQQRTSIAA